MVKRKMNEFHDINKFPNQPGLFVFGISMSKIGNIQSAKKCFDYMEHFISKIFYPHVGLVFIYGDSLYFYSSEKASKLKVKHQALSNCHKQAFIKILKRHPLRIPSSFSFMTWSQTLLESKDFINYFGRLKKLYDKDKLFKKYVREDIKKSGKNLSKDNVDFVLEEILVLYLISKRKIKLPNEYVQGKEKWVLNCYPGKPLKSEIYLYQRNPFKINDPESTFQNSFYDLESKKLYDYDNVNLKTIRL